MNDYFLDEPIELEIKRSCFTFRDMMWGLYDPKPIIPNAFRDIKINQLDVVTISEYADIVCDKEQ